MRLGLEMVQVVVIVVKVLCLLKMSCVVKNHLWGFGNSLLLLGDFVVEVSWYRLFCDFCDSVCWNSVRSHADNPVLNCEFALSLLKKFFKILLLGFVGCKPSLVLNTDDIIERLVLWEITIDALKIFLVSFKQGKKSIHAKLVEPPVLCQD